MSNGSTYVNGNGQTIAVSESGAEKEVKLARFDLMPVGPITELAEHYGRGAKKYADHNWAAGFDWGHSYASLQRHLTAFWGGEDVDPETGSKHIIAAMWHCATLAYFMDHHPDYDNRYSTLKRRADEAEPVPQPDEILTRGVLEDSYTVTQDRGGVSFTQEEINEDSVARLQRVLARAQENTSRIRNG